MYFLIPYSNVLDVKLFEAPQRRRPEKWFVFSTRRCSLNILQSLRDRPWLLLLLHDFADFLKNIYLTLDTSGIDQLCCLSFSWHLVCGLHHGGNAARKTSFQRQWPYPFEFLVHFWIIYLCIYLFAGLFILLCIVLY